MEDASVRDGSLIRKNSFVRDSIRKNSMTRIRKDSFVRDGSLIRKNSFVRDGSLIRKNSFVRDDPGRIHPEGFLRP